LVPSSTVPPLSFSFIISSTVDCSFDSSNDMVTLRPPPAAGRQALRRRDGSKRRLPSLVSPTDVTNPQSYSPGPAAGC
jgi:hypothetical protein